MSGETLLTLAHSISLARSRSVAWSVASRWRRAASASMPSLDWVSSGSSRWWTRGQKNRSWRRAAEWNVRACTPGAPRARSRSRISPAARVVNESASTSVGA